MVAAGRLRHQVIIQAPKTAQNALGEAVRSWLDLATVWADVQPISGREYWAASQVQSSTTHRVTLRPVDGLTTACRILFGSRALGIDSIINPGERGERLELLCTEGPRDA